MTPVKVLSLLSLVGMAILCFANQDPQPPRQPPAPKPALGKAIECRWLVGTIKLDGLIQERSWKEAASLTLHVPWEKRSAHTAATARLLWDREFLYFSAEMEDHDLYADVKDASGPVWENDCFALFLKPHENKLGYHVFQINAANTQSQLYLPSRGAGGAKRFAADAESKIESVVKLNGTLNNWHDKDKGWTIEGRIPWSAFQASGGRPKTGDRWRFALCRYDYSVTLDRPELSTTAPLTMADFHRYEEYQEIVFMDRQ